LDAAAMSIDSVRVNGLPAAVSQAGDSLTIALPWVARSGDTLLLEVFYTSRTTRNIGLYLYRKGTFVGVGPGGDSVFVEERIAYTMSEPEDARYWMPCNDAPHDKAIAEITVAVPEGVVVASNGWLDTVRVVPGTPTVHLYRWKDTVPIATYLMVVHASRYAHWREEYRRPDGSTVPLFYYVWAPDVESPDTTGRRYNARYAFRNVPAMLRAYESFFGRYPFGKYGMAAVQPFGYGGMEHQTMTTINRSWLRGFSELGIAHELAHHWLGDLVSCATWKDIWLNEGGATWSEALWLEWTQGAEAYQNRMQQARNDYLRYRDYGLQQPLYAPPMSALFFYATTYAKAAWVYHMLRRMLGDSLFFPALRSYMARHRYGAAETEDLLASLQADIPNPPVPWRTFFDQWVYSAGHPVLTIVPSVSVLPEGRYLVRCSIEQTQGGLSSRVPEVFVMPWKLIFQGAQGEYAEHSFLSTQRQQVVEVVLPFFPTVIRLNDQDVLCEYSVAPLAVGSTGESEGVRARLLPQPLRGEEGTLEFSVPTAGTVSVELVTLTGARERLYESFLPAGTYRLPLWLQRRHYAAGTYAIRLWKDGSPAVTLLFQWEP
jgi:aminopeptidase N